jgi:inner membrane transporter RhtA
VAVVSSRRRIDLVWVLLAVGGILALTRGGTGHLSLLGVGFALIAGAFWAAYILLNARIGQIFQGGSGLALAMCVASVLAVPLGVADAGAKLLSVHALVVGSAVGMLSSAIPYSCEAEALRRIDPGVFAVLMSLEPAAAALAGLLVLGQGLSVRTGAGIVLVVLASVGASLGSRRAPIAV